jgi:hypothetical protein
VSEPAPRSDLRRPLIVLALGVVTSAIAITNLIGSPAKTPTPNVLVSRSAGFDPLTGELELRLTPPDRARAKPRVFGG